MEKRNRMSADEDSIPKGKPVASREIGRRSSYPSVNDLPLCLSDLVFELLISYTSKSFTLG